MTSKHVLTTVSVITFQLSRIDSMRSRGKPLPLVVVVVFAIVSAVVGGGVGIVDEVSDDDDNNDADVG